MKCEPSDEIFINEIPNAPDFNSGMIIFRAPTDCYQYLTGVSGTLTSFNYPTAALELIRYTSCVRREAGYCGILWAQSQYTSGDGGIATVTPDPFALDTILTTGIAVSFFKTFQNCQNVAFFTSF